MTYVCEASVQLKPTPQRRPHVQLPREGPLTPPPLSHPTLRRALRLQELSIARRFFGPGRELLEVGAGAGWQANALTDLGYSVMAIEISESNYTDLREYPIRDYDGKHVPAADESFDIIFSSNVLEHVPHITEFHRELWRVLRPNGTAVHVMPTATWRFWTTISFFMRRAMQLVGRRKRKQTSVASHKESRPTKTNLSTTLRQALLPSTHGVRGNWCTELFYFTEIFWRRTLQTEGWHIERVVKNNLFYTGNKICGEGLSLETRSLLSRFLGSSCKVYVIRKVAH